MKDFFFVSEKAHAITIKKIMFGIEIKCSNNLNRVRSLTPESQLRMEEISCNYCVRLEIKDAISKLFFSRSCSVCYHVASVLVRV